MFMAINKKIILLKRVAIAEIKLGNLKTGEFKPLTKEELNIINKYYDIFKTKQNKRS
jgi:16S rRNA U516 pseudouridylate synthase RsuA-like enzyme